MFRSFVAAAGVAAAACSSSTTGNGDTAELRLIHASAATGTVDLEVAGQPVVTGLAFGQSSALEEVPAGSQTIVARSGGQVIGTLTATLSSQRVNSFVVSAGTVQMSSDVVPDTGSVAPTRANLRFVVVATTNAAAPTQLDALLSGTSIGQDSTQRFGGFDAQVARYYSLLYYDPGQFTVRFVAAGTSTPVLAEATFSVAVGETKAAVLSRAAGGSYTVDIVTEH
ncbi:MAG: DUF4397 domain-containing protein [Gemmatimonadales bacterium]